MKGISNRNIYKELKKTVAQEGCHYQRENHRTTILLLLAFLHPLKKKNIKPRCYCHCQCLRQCHKWQNDPESVLQYGTPSPSSIPSRTPYVLVSRFPWSVPQSSKTPAYDLNQDVWCRVAGRLQGQVFG